LMRAARNVLALAISLSSLLSGAGCKKSKAELDAEESQKIIERHAELRKQLHRDKIARTEREAWLKAHPEVLESAEPDEEHRPTAPVPSNLPPSLLGASPPPEPAASSSAPSPSASAAPRISRPKKAHESSP